MSFWSKNTRWLALTKGSHLRAGRHHWMPRVSLKIFVLLIVSFGIQDKLLIAQQPPSATPAGTVKLNLRGETPISTLIEYVSQRLNIRFIYDESLAQKKIFLQAPDEIPVASVMDLLQSALRINDLVIVETEAKGWYRITSGTNIPKVAIPATSQEKIAEMGAAVPVTQVFVLKRADPTQIKELIASFLTAAGANSIPVPANRTVIVTDVASNLRRIQRLIELLDAEQFTSTIRFVPVKYVPIIELSEQLQELLAARARTEVGPMSSTTSATDSTSKRSAGSVPGIEIAIDRRTNQLIMVGVPARIESAIELLKSLDIPLTTTSQIYRPQFLSPKQLDDILQPIVDSMAPRPVFESRVEGSGLVIKTTDLFQQQIARLIPQIDTRETSAKQSPIRFYKIKNIPVQDITETLNSLQGGVGQNPFGTAGGSQSRNLRSGTTNDRAVPGRNNPFVVGANNAQPGLLPPQPSAMRNGLLDTNANAFAQGLNNGGFNPQGLPTGNNQFGGQFNNPYAYQLNGFPSYGNGFLQNGLGNQRGIQSPLGNAQVTADIGSNTLIIIAEPEVQQAYQQLIEFLDKRRPQVMIEARIVVIDTSDDYTLGVEVSGGERNGLKKLFAFSSYGLSTVTPATGALAITPGTGFNGTLVDPATADVVVRALATHRRARVLSSPKILVDDNAEGTLESVNEVPFTSVNASQTVATTSFAGFAKAGTTIVVTPTISEGEHVNLDYTVTLNSFTGPGSTGVPPPRQTNEISSRVTVPDGYTIIVGGLTQKNVSSTLNGIPYLERIPIIRALTSLASNNTRDSSLFVFLRPVILEEDQFRDLKQLSKRSAQAACDGHNFPSSSPLLMSK
jgi:general secretion pathway protein D